MDEDAFDSGIYSSVFLQIVAQTMVLISISGWFLVGQHQSDHRRTTAVEKSMRTVFDARVDSSAKLNDLVIKSLWCFHKFTECRLDRRSRHDLGDRNAGTHNEVNGDNDQDTGSGRHFVFLYSERTIGFAITFETDCSTSCESQSPMWP